MFLYWFWLFAVQFWRFPEVLGTSRNPRWRIQYGRMGDRSLWRRGFFLYRYLQNYAVTRNKDVNQSIIVFLYLLESFLSQRETHAIIKACPKSSTMLFLIQLLKASSTNSVKYFYSRKKQSITLQINNIFFSRMLKVSKTSIVRKTLTK